MALPPFLIIKSNRKMKEESKSEFLEKVEKFSNEMHAFMETDAKKRGLIIIASEYNADEQGSRQTGTIDGIEGELIKAIAGFIEKPQCRELILKSLIVSGISVTKSSKEEQE